jgi:hypothetical protein
MLLVITGGRQCSNCGRATGVLPGTPVQYIASHPNTKNNFCAASDLITLVVMGNRKHYNSAMLVSASQGREEAKKPQRSTRRSVPSKQAARAVAAVRARLGYRRPPHRGLIFCTWLCACRSHGTPTTLVPGFLGGHRVHPYVFRRLSNICVHSPSSETGGLHPYPQTLLIPRTR